MCPERDVSLAATASAIREPLIQKLTSRLIDGLEGRGWKITSPLDKDRRSGIDTFEVPDATRAAHMLLSQGVVVAPRVNTLRVSPHFFKTENEIDAFLEKIGPRNL